MEPIQQPMQPIMTYPPVQKEKKKGWIVVGGALIILAGAVWFFVHHKATKKLTPAQTLQQLEQTSKPVTETPAQRKAELDTLAKQSAPVKTSTDQRMQLLQQLHGTSQ